MRLLSILAVLAALCLPANAQVGRTQAIVVSSCGSVTGLTVGQYYDLYMTTDGKLCFQGSTTTPRSPGTPRSASVATTAANLWPQNLVRQGAWIKNDGANNIWCNYDATATAVPGGGNFKIASGGGYYVTDVHSVSTNALSCIAEGAAVNVTSREQ